MVLQNRSAYFSLDPAHPNCVAPGKTPLHTLIASLALRNHKLWGVVGCMGADGQPQIHAQTYAAMIDHGRNIQEAVEAPRWLSGRFGLRRCARHPAHRGALSGARRLPNSNAAATRSTAGATGTSSPAMRTASRSMRDSGMRLGGSDPRSDGAAIGY